MKLRLRHWLFFLIPAVACAAQPAWLERVDPVITPAEKKAYLALSPEARDEFEQKFWATKAITGDEYFRRVEYIDSTFGSGKAGSGARTDQGRVWLALGAPSRVTHVPSSRIFVPTEIWYYDIIPSVINTEVRLLFFRENSQGFPKLYSPQTDKIRALLIPQAGTRSMFGPNDSITESDIRQKLQVGPAEDEVVAAAVNVAVGVHDSGNEELLGRISSPEAMLGKPLRSEISSRLIVSRMKTDVFQTPSAFGGSQVDLRLDASAKSEISIEVVEDNVTVYQNRLALKFPAAEVVAYTHRLDLLPGEYRVLFTVDGQVSPVFLNVPASPSLGNIARADWVTASSGHATPFQFDGQQLDLNPEGRYAVLPLAKPGKVTWMIRHGSEVIWRAASDGQTFASVELPTKGITAGAYRLEAVTENDSRTTEFVVRADATSAPPSAVVSFNANLAPALRHAFVGHQWLLRGQNAQARQSLEASLRSGVTEEAQIELARADALSGNLDSARDRVRGVLAKHPDSFEALSVFAYIETGFQDYVVAADLYRRALALQDSPALRAALSKLPAQYAQSQ